MAEDLLHDLEGHRFDRRALLVGGASVAAGVAFMRVGSAAADVGISPWTGGVVDSVTGSNVVVMSEMPLQAQRTVSVLMTPTTGVRADISPGKTIMVDGTFSSDGSAITAQQVIPVFYGTRSDVQR